MELEQLFEQYKKYVLGNKPDKQRKTEEGRWNLHIAPLLGKLPVDLIKGHQIMQLKNDLIEKGLSQQSVYHCLSLTLRLIRKAIEWEYFEGPAPACALPKVSIQSQLSKNVKRHS